MMGSFWDVFGTTFSVFVLIAALFLWGLVMVDLFADRTIGGGAKAAWVVLLFVLPVVGALIYLVARDVSKRRLAETLRPDA
jgi:uncharacterized protein YqhQ